jgi:hypothetical protein
MAIEVVDVDDAAEPLDKPTEPAPTQAPAPANPGDVLPDAISDGPPAWAVIPDKMKIQRGRQMIFVRFPAEWTDVPERGLEIGGEPGLWRMCIITPCSVADKRMAANRCEGKSQRLTDEMCKQTIRSVDGHISDWSGSKTPGSIDNWWNEIGEKCRNELTRIFLKLHQLNEGERVRFFESCIAVRTAG